MSGLSPDDLSELLKASLSEQAPEVAVQSHWFDFCYTASGRLEDLVAEVERLAALPPKTKGRTRDLGNALERVAFELFRGICREAEIRSWRSALAQYDLVCRGTTLRWVLLKGLLPGKVDSFLVESKAHKDPVGHGVFSRVCSLLVHTFRDTVACGVFITLNGASGFPARGSNQAQQKLSESRLQQVIFYHAAGKPIIVFDLEDLRELAAGANFVAMVRQRLVDIEDLSGLAPEKLDEVPLPRHLQDLLDLDGDDDKCLEDRDPDEGEA